MRKDGRIWRPDLSDRAVRAGLVCRPTPYYLLLEYGRHLGIFRDADGDRWTARLRTRAGTYRRHVLGYIADPDRADGIRTLTFDQALEKAKAWFNLPANRAFASEAKPRGILQNLIVCPIGSEFSVAHAMSDYIEWKRIAAARTHFETNLSLVNYHIIPRLGNLRVADFDGDVLRRFVREVLETPPKRGSRPLGPRQAISSLDDDALRKRKKTVNTLISVLRQSFKMAWESRKIDNDRAWLVLHRIPMVDRPRTLHLSRNECRGLLAECRPDLQRLVLGALYTGCRSGELTRMRCSQVGRDGYGIYIEPLKSYHPRFVFLPDEAMYWFLSLIADRKPKDLVFVRDNGQPWYDRYKSLFKAAVRAAGLPDEFTFHGLRHTYASQLVQAGATVFAVADQLGHVDPSTVLRTYGHLSPQMREAEVRQRFTTISPENAAEAESHRETLHQWRSDLHGGDWRTYAVIQDVTDGDAALWADQASLPLPASGPRTRWIGGTQGAGVRRRPRW